MKANVMAVQRMLRVGAAIPADEVARLAGVPLEHAYEALVRLEGHGWARVRPINGSRVLGWSAPLGKGAA
jgi:DNA-binding GntR family transcriptional regulator